MESLDIVLRIWGLRNMTRQSLLSLGDREEKTRNSVMAQVGNCIRSGYDWLKECGVDCTLEWNSGNHFRDPDMRTAKAFVWVLNQEKT